MSCQCSMVQKMVNELTEKESEVCQDLEILKKEIEETFRFSLDDSPFLKKVLSLFSIFKPAFGVSGKSGYVVINYDKYEYIEYLTATWQVEIIDPDIQLRNLAIAKLEEFQKELQSLSQYEEPQPLIDSFKKCHDLLDTATNIIDTARRNKGMNPMERTVVDLVTKAKKFSEQELPQLIKDFESKGFKIE